MKKHILSMLILICALNIPLSAQFDTRQYYEHKIHTYGRVKTEGMIMTGVGAGVTIVGVVLLTNVKWTSEDNGDGTSSYHADTSESGKIISGSICALAGFAVFTTGIVLGCIGSHKVKEYIKIVDKMAFDLKCTPKKQGFVLTYRF
jgi:hypothetical protein